MRSLLLLLLFLAGFVPARAQHFDWAAAGANLNGGFTAMTVDAQGNIIAAGNMYLPGYYHGESYLLSSSSDTLEVRPIDKPMLVVSYTPSGTINWKVEVPQCDAPAGIAIDGKGRIVVLAKTSPWGRARIPGLETVYEGRRAFLLTLSGRGEPLSVVQDTADRLEDVTDFRVIDGQHFIVSGGRYHSERSGEPWGNVTQYLLRLDSNLSVVWERSLEQKGSGGVFDPANHMDVAPNGDIYLAGNYMFGIRFPGGEAHEAAVVEPETQFVKPYEAYVSCFSGDGKLKWVRHSGGKSLIRAVKAVPGGVLVGGEIVRNGDPFGMAADTLKGKRMLLASFGRGGSVKWLRTGSADKVQALTADKEGNCYASVSTKVFDSLVYEKDTLRHTFETLIIASYAPDGKFRWVKGTRVPMNYNERVLLSADRCGNLFVGGELWATLHMQLRWFDGAFLRGDAYGDAPFVARIRNTLPDVLAEKLARQKGACLVSPGPWEIMNFPNPFASVTTIRYRLTYADRVRISVYDMSGRLVKIVLEKPKEDAGTHTFRFDRNGLASGAYLLVLRGTEATASTQMLLLR